MLWGGWGHPISESEHISKSGHVDVALWLCGSRIVINMTLTTKTSRLPPLTAERSPSFYLIVIRLCSVVHARARARNTYVSRRPPPRYPRACPVVCALYLLPTASQSIVHDNDIANDKRWVLRRFGTTSPGTTADEDTTAPARLHHQSDTTADTHGDQPSTIRLE